MAIDKTNLTVAGLLGLGFSSEQANALGVGLDSSVAALGTALSTAATSTADTVYVGSTASNNAGLQLRNTNNFTKRQVVINAGASTLTVYPPLASTGVVGSINNATSTTIASGLGAQFDAVGDGQYWKK